MDAFPPTSVKIKVDAGTVCPKHVVEYFTSAVVTQEGYCNSTNHHSLAPPDWPVAKDDHTAFMKRYNKECEPFMYTSWAEPLGMKDFLVVTLPRHSVACLCEAGRVSILTGKLPSHLEDDIQDITDTIDSQVRKAGEPWSNPDSKFFIRLDDCSPKDNGGLRPLRTGKEILGAILGSKRCMLRIEYAHRENLTDVKIIMKLWRPDIDSGNEFRIFVVDGFISGISQYHWFEDSGWGAEPKKSKIPFVVKGIQDLFDTIKSHLPFTSCVYDTHVKFIQDDDGESVLVELVEFNPFGAHISSGSALFHWEKDFDTLNGIGRDENTPAYVRFVHNGE